MERKAVMRESRTVEFKETVSDSFLKTVSAFANYGGGTVLFGVADDGATVGVNDPVAVALQVENKINDSVSPRPSFTLSVNEKTKVVSLSVDEGPHKPYLYRAKAYRRSDSATVEVDHLELRRLVLTGEHLTFEETAARRQDLSFDLLGVWVKRIMGIRSITQDTLKTLELYSDAQGFNVAAELLADENGFPGIDGAVFGASVSIIRDRKTFEHMSVLSQYERAVDLFRTHCVYEKVDGFERREVQVVPEEAFREAVANALVHRLWDAPSHIRISFYPDRIEVVSPGGLPSGISEEEYLTDRVSVLRNPILGNVFYRLGIIERFGTGVTRIREAYRESELKPSFKVSENSITVVLPSVESGKALTDDERAVLAVMGASMMRSSSEIAEEAGMSKSKALRIVQRLLAEGRLEAVGEGRGRKYRLAR